MEEINLYLKVRKGKEWVEKMIHRRNKSLPKNPFTTLQRIIVTNKTTHIDGYK